MWVTLPPSMLTVLPAEPPARREVGEPIYGIGDLEMRLCGARAVHLTGDTWSLTSNRIGADNTRRGQRRGPSQSDRPSWADSGDDLRVQIGYAAARKAEDTRYVEMAGRVVLQVYQGQFGRLAGSRGGRWQTRTSVL